MNKPEQFKRTIAFLLNALILVSLSLVYAYIWHVNYNTIIIQPFLGKGNWLNIAIYLVLLYFFSRIYGAAEPCMVMSDGVRRSWVFPDSVPSHRQCDHVFFRLV
ncbi:MAG: hypothetical protein ACLR23_24465 [Clostridia bacterium]